MGNVTAPGACRSFPGTTESPWGQNFAPWGRRSAQLPSPPKQTFQQLNSSRVNGNSRDAMQSPGQAIRAYSCSRSERRVSARTDRDRENGTYPQEVNRYCPAELETKLQDLAYSPVCGSAWWEEPSTAGPRLGFATGTPKCSTLTYPQAGFHGVNVDEQPADYSYAFSAEIREMEQAALLQAANPHMLPLQTLCPTPAVLGPLCGRGERELQNWHRSQDSNELLGTCAEMISQTARYIYEVMGTSGNKRRTVRILSAADGCADDSLPDMQARYVPTSVMLAHSFAITAGSWQDQQTHIRVFGADLRNIATRWWQSQQLPWRMPHWLELRFVALDNTQNFKPQLYGTLQCEQDLRFDAVLLRQGLCFCDDPSKTSPAWPTEIFVSCDRSRAWARPGLASAHVPCLESICGTYQLEPMLFEGRPAYRKDGCVLRWCPDRLEWAVLDTQGGAWAYARGDLGHPVLARGPWTVWDGQSHVSDSSFGCSLAQPGATPPWYRPPAQRICCCGVTGDTASVLQLLQRVEQVLDPQQPHSFGLIHGAWTNGTLVEVQQLHQQMQEAARLFNDLRTGLYVACVLWRTAAKEYWLQCDGIMLFQIGSRVDPFRAYAGLPPLFS